MLSLNKETFLLLDQYSTALKNIAGKLEKDKEFTSFVAKETMNSSTSAYTITEYVFFEIVSIFNLCADPLKNQFERFGIVFIGLKFYDPKYLTNHENINALLRGDKKEIINHYINYTLRVKEYNSSILPTPSSLLFPKILKLSHHPLLDDYATALYRFASLIVNLDDEITDIEKNALQKVWQLTHDPLILDPQSEEENTFQTDDTETVEDILKELDGLIGLTNVKQEVSALVDFVKIQKERKKIGLKTSQVSYHCVFTGAPGTGKTTVARLIAKIYKTLGILKKGHLIETDRAGLIAEYSGQTAVKVDGVIQSALDGVLFIDEAYSLLSENNDSYGQEAVATLIKRIEDNRDRLIVIIAGYPDEMEAFITNNPGLKSRFNRYIHFEDYSAKELVEIFKTFCTKLEYNLTKKASSKLVKTFQQLINEKDDTFGNGRLSRNLFEKAIEKQASRLTLSEKPLTKELLITIEAEDIPD